MSQSPAGDYLFTPESVTEATTTGTAASTAIAAGPSADAMPAAV